jgi:hypothetical protein
LPANDGLLTDTDDVRLQALDERVLLLEDAALLDGFTADEIIAALMRRVRVMEGY